MDVKLGLRISIGIALNKLPWSLLTGAEKRGPRDRQTMEQRVDYAAKIIAEQIELSPKLRERYRR